MGSDQTIPIGYYIEKDYKKEVVRFNAAVDSNDAKVLSDLKDVRVVSFRIRYVYVVIDRVSLYCRNGV